MMNLFTKQNDSPTRLPNASAPPAPEPSFERYVDPTGESGGKEFRYGMWYVRHRVRLYRLAVAGLAAIGAVLWAFSLWRWGDYLIFGLANDSALAKQASQFMDYRPAERHFAAAPLSVLSTDIFVGGVEKYDAVSEVANPNDWFLARGAYYYIIDGERTAARSFLILPGASALLAELGIKSAAAPGSAELVIETMSWKRVSPHQIKDPKTWQESRLDFVLSDFVFTPFSGGDGAKANVITFNLANRSSFSYVNPRFYIGLLNRDVLVGVMPLAVDSFASLETKKIDLRNFVNTLAADSARLFPLIDIYDSAAYLPPVK